MNRIKILIITSIVEISASPPLITLINELTNNGFHVEIAYTPSGKYNKPIFKSTLVKTHIASNIKGRFIIPGIRMISFIIGTIKICFKIQPDLYVAVHVEALFSAVILSFFRPCPIVFYSTELREFNQYKNIIWKIRKIIEILCQKRVALTIVQDENRAKLLKKLNKTPNAKINIIPVGLVNTFIINKKSNYLRKKYNIQNDKFIILMSGTIANWTSSLEVVKIANTWSSNKVLIIHGKAEEKRYLEKVRKYCDGKKVILSEDFLSQDEYDKMTISADIGLAIYKKVNENIYNMGTSSGKLMQYMRCLLPVITMKWPSLIDIIEKSQSGICINDFTEIEEAIDKIMNNRNYYAKNAYKTYAEKLDPKQYFKKFFHSLKSLCKE